MQNNIETVQDKNREEKLRKLLNLIDPKEGRMGCDAIDNKNRKYELKSMTKNSCTTSRDVGLHTIQKWRTRHWIIGKGKNLKNGFVFEEIYYVSKKNMEEWYLSIENKIKPDLDLLKKITQILKKNKKITKLNIERLDYLIKRGYTLNNPKIPLDYIKKKGTLLTEPYDASLIESVKLN